MIILNHNYFENAVLDHNYVETLSLKSVSVLVSNLSFYEAVRLVNFAWGSVPNLEAHRAAESQTF